MNSFKSLPTQFFENIKVTGMYERHLCPVCLIAFVSFYVTPTKISIESSDDEFEDLRKDNLSLSVIDRSAKRNLSINQGWKFDGSRFTYSHSENQVRKNRNSALGIDFYFTRIDETEDIGLFFQVISKQISDLEIFKSSEYFVIQSKKNAKKDPRHSPLVVAECN